MSPVSYNAEVQEFGANILTLVADRVDTNVLCRIQILHFNYRTGMERNLGEWRRMNVVYECDGMNVGMY
jgi:hypothetical protein